MNFRMKKTIVLLLVLLTIGWVWSSASGTDNEINLELTESKTVSDQRIKEAKEFARSNKMDTTIAVFVDMSISSGKNRMFVWHFDSSKVIFATLCAHGSCDESFASNDVVFSNVPESHCSSKGKYRIGKRGYSNWGTHFNYKLHGLEASNNNAYKRIIVLHSYEYVPDTEVYPAPILTSWGCPMVSNNSLIYLDMQLKKVKKPVLLWIYN